MFAILAAGCAIASNSDLESPIGICRLAKRMAAAWSYRFDTPDGNVIANVEDWIDHAAAFEPLTAARTGGGHTCHLNTADKTGMLVSTTLTHGKLWFGARWVLPGTGIIMNYGGPAVCDPRPNVVDDRAYGVTNMSPTIVRFDDGAAIAIGSPGARRIASIISLGLTRHIFGRVPLQEALLRGRVHAEDRNRATLELDRLPPAADAALRATFEVVEAERAADYYGPCTAIRRDSDGALALGVDDRWPGFGTSRCVVMSHCLDSFVGHSLASANMSLVGTEHFIEWNITGRPWAGQVPCPKSIQVAGLSRCEQRADRTCGA